MSRPKVFVFWTWEDKLPWITEELRAGRLRQGWGGKGTALTDEKGRLLSVEVWVRVSHDFFTWGEDEDQRRTRYSILKTMLEMKPGDLVVVPRVPTGGTFTIAVVAEGYHFDDRHFFSEQPHVPVNDCGHVVEVERDSQRVFSVDDPDAALVSRQFRHYRRAVNAVRAVPFANQVRALFQGTSTPRVAEASVDYGYSPFVSDPKIMGGETVFAGTRVPLRTVLASLAEGDPFEEILRAFPSLKREHVLAAVQFAAQSSLEDQPIRSVPKLS